VSGLVFEGNEALLLKLGAIGACSLLTTRYILEEVSRTLARKEFRLGQEEITGLLSILHGSVVVHEDVDQAELKNHLSRLDDKKDVHVLAAYEKLKCEMLVTGDKELLKKVTGANTTRRVLELLLNES
jgi:predicted nucleic acid-binding protein